MLDRAKSSFVTPPYGSDGLDPYSAMLTAPLCPSECGVCVELISECAPRSEAAAGL